MPLPMINISNVHNNTGLDEKQLVHLTRIGPHIANVKSVHCH